MLYFWIPIAFFYVCFNVASSLNCNTKCPSTKEPLKCAFDAKKTQYLVFPSNCSLHAYADCNEIDFVETLMEFCIKQDNKVEGRRYYGESCPTFCPKHYRPVCGASKYRDYSYRTFINGCHLDILNCRGDDEYSEYVEVPLDFCPRHAMKNVFKEKILVSKVNDYVDHF